MEAGVQVSEKAVGSGLRLENVEKVDINVRNLSVTVKGGSGVLSKVKNKLFQGNISEDGDNFRSNILQDVSLDVPSGSVMAVIGGSGSGKTSLLNVIADRMSSGGLNIDGQVLFNRQPDLHKVKNAYVLQQDILQPRLTCKETLHYAGELRLPASVSKQERKELVEQIIAELGLKECADTLVGDNEHKGLSGGEKRRLSIGIQLLANPSVLFLDEPTTGLDANSAYLLVQTCHKLAAKGRTLIMSIHQPRSDIFFLFDKITILSRGQSVFSGEVSNSLDYFGNLGYTFPEHVNPADYLIDLAAIDTRTPEQEEASLQRVNKLVNAWNEHKYFPPVSETEWVSEWISKMKAPLSREISVLTRRFSLLSYRDPMGLGGLFLECTLMGVICGWIFYKLDDSLAGIRSTQGLLYTACAAQGYLLLLYETYRLCGPDLKVFDREYNEGCVSVLGYLVSRRLSKCLTEDLFVPLIFSVSCITC
jgi:ABC-type multidrug transport system ATPase subunit